MTPSRSSGLQQASFAQERYEALCAVGFGISDPATNCADPKPAVEDEVQSPYTGLGSGHVDDVGLDALVQGEDRSDLAFVLACLIRSPSRKKRHHSVQASSLDTARKWSMYASRCRSKHALM